VFERVPHLGDPAVATRFRALRQRGHPRA
jgi:hypothetical protein